MTTHNKTSLLGKKGEEAVICWLKNNGYHILASNFFARLGEIDIVGIDGAHGEGRNLEARAAERHVIHVRVP